MSEKNQENYRLRRLGAAVLLGTLSLGIFHLTGELMDKISASKHVSKEIEIFSDPNLKNNLQDTLKKNNISPTSVETYTASNLDHTPTDVASSMRAKDPQLVAQIVSNQEGGAGNLHAGDTIFIPKDLLKPLPESTNQ